MAVKFGPKILGLSVKIFGNDSKQSRTVLRFGFDPGTDVFGFYCVFWYHSDSVTNGTKNCL